LLRPVGRPSRARGARLIGRSQIAPSDNRAWSWRAHRAFVMQRSGGCCSCRCTRLAGASGGSSGAGPLSGAANWRRARFVVAGPNGALARRTEVRVLRLSRGLADTCGAPVPYAQIADGHGAAAFERALRGLHELRPMPCVCDVGLLPPAVDGRANELVGALDEAWLVPGQAVKVGLGCGVAAILKHHPGGNEPAVVEAVGEPGRAA